MILFSLTHRLLTLTLTLNSLEYYTLGVVEREREVNKQSHHSNLLWAMSQIDKYHLIWVCQHFRSCIEAAIEINKGLIE